MKNNGKLISVKGHDRNINLHALTTKLLKAQKPALKEDYEFKEAFNIPDQIDNNGNKLNEYKPWFSNQIITKRGS